MSRPLTALQAHALGVIDDYGPIPTSEVSRHLLVDPMAARNAVVGLEKRGLVSPNYTSYERQTAYETTDEGHVAVTTAFEDASAGVER